MIRNRFILHPRLGVIAMALEPLDCPLHTLFKSNLCFPAHQVFRSLYIEASAGLAVGFGGVPFDFVCDCVFACETGELGDHVDQVFDRDLHVGSQVDRGWVVHLLGCG